MLFFSVLSLLISNVTSATIGIGFIFGSRSHVVPYFDSLSMLVERGHRVLFVAFEKDLSFSKDYPLIEAHGLKSDDSSILETEKDTITQKMVDSDKTDLASLLDLMRLMNKNFKDSYLSFSSITKEQNVDYWLCDFFASACEDAAINNDVDYAILGGVGFMGYQDVWYTPSMIHAYSQREWVDSYWLRTISILKTWMVIPYALQIEKELSDIRRDLGIAVSLDEKKRLTSRRLYFAHGILGLIPARPLPPNYFVVGPVWPRNVSSMSVEIQSILDDCVKRGKSVIYIAFGSIAPGFSGVMNKVAQAVKFLLEGREDIVVLWATTTTTVDLGFESDRLILKRWVRQKPVLLHPVVKVFITHGGLSSIHESIYAGKPMVVIPLFADQFYNAIQVEDAGLGKALRKNEFTPESLRTTIHKLVEDIQKPSLKKQLQKYQRIAQLNSATHLPLIANMVEMAAQVGIEHLIPVTANMSFFQEYPPIYLLLCFLSVFIAIKILESICIDIYKRLWRIISNSKIWLGNLPFKLKKN